MFKKLVTAIIISIAVVVFLPLAVSIYLSPQDKLEKSDAIVVVSGGDTDARISKGVELYMQEWAPKIIFSGAAAEGEVSNALAMKRIAVSAGVSPEDVIIEEDSKTTFENADFTADLIQKNGFKSVIIVTSPYHQRRTYLLFRKNLGEEFVIINHSAIDETWRKRNWWDNANSRFLTFGEVLKNFYQLTFGK